MRIRDLVNRLEKIESKADGEVQEMCSTLIDDLIEFDIHMEKNMKGITRKIEEDFMEMLMTEGIKSGSIGEA
jgi:hypothetical protein|tara:strand:+ start:4422 stop:4637 length:216 start_codon:yes stop_codon:yes gene_type:complete